MTLYPQILNEKQEELIEKLGFLKFPPYYLGGGTALALQVGHRTSLDFDFYSKDKFDSKSLFTDAEIVDRTDDTLQAVMNEVNVSMFYYPYKLIDDLVEFGGIKMAGLHDIAAMKVIAIVQRARQRDFIDIYYLINLIGLEKIIQSVYQKYPWYEDNNQILFKALTYFDDADEDSEADRIKVFDTSVAWEKVKKELRLAVLNIRH